MRKQIFHNEKAQQINVLDSRYYTNDGTKFYPSVTTILDVYPKGFGFNQWLRDVGSNAEQIADRAAETGSRVHKACEMLNNGVELAWIDENGKSEYTVEEWKMILRYSDFFKSSGAEIVANEANFCNSDLGYGGTLDLVVNIGGNRWLIDIKTSNYLHTSHELQVAAYATLWNAAHAPLAKPDDTNTIDQTAILWLKAATKTEKTDHEKGIYQGAGWQLKTFDRHYSEAYKIFQHTHAIWKEENPNYKPANLIYPDRINLQILQTV